jgi:hypothetical protein
VRLLVDAVSGGFWGGAVCFAERSLLGLPFQSIITSLSQPATRATQEDWDSAPCAELVPRASPLDGSPGGAAAKGAVSCLVAHPPSGRVWAGTNDGRVHCWLVAGGGVAAKWQHSWAAHGGRVKAMAVSAWGRLFTGEWLSSGDCFNHHHLDDCKLPSFLTSIGRV